jgi:AcrR family transcriptional regulator
VELPSDDDGTRQTILDAACRHLWEHDEELLRIADICHETGLSSNTVFAHYYSRQHLVDAAYLAIYKDVTDNILTNTRDAMAKAQSVGEFIGILRGFLGDPARVKEPHNRRHMLLRIATAAIGRTPMQRDYAALQHEYLTGLTGCFADLVDRRVIGDLLTARQLAVIFELAVLMRAFIDFDDEPSSDDTVLAMLETVLRSSHQPSTA